MEITELKMESPVGPLRLVATDAGICRIAFSRDAAAVRRELGRRFGGIRVSESSRRRNVLERAQKALGRYFSGREIDVDRLSLDPGGTEFQQDVWACLRTIPRGETRSYGDVAAAIRRPKAVRAVGSANRANPIPIIVPCHRVIGSDGELRGYAGRLDRKEWLLRHENALPA
jgi:O-6-methylguanine DNA methyltransferase